MKKEMLINVLQPEECRIAILEDGILEELYVERTSQESYVGNIYKGRIVNIEPSIQAAFVDFGIGRNGFLHVSDVDRAYYQHLLPTRSSRADRGGRGGRADRDRDRDRSGRRSGKIGAFSEEELAEIERGEPIELDEPFSESATVEPATTPLTELQDTRAVGPSESVALRADDDGPWGGDILEEPRHHHPPAADLASAQPPFSSIDEPSPNWGGDLLNELPPVETDPPPTESVGPITTHTPSVTPVLHRLPPSGQADDVNVNELDDAPASQANFGGDLLIDDDSLPAPTASGRTTQTQSHPVISQPSETAELAQSYSPQPQSSQTANDAANDTDTDTALVQKKASRASRANKKRKKTTSANDPVSGSNDPLEPTSEAESARHKAKLGKSGKRRDRASQSSPTDLADPADSADADTPPDPSATDKPRRSRSRRKPKPDDDNSDDKPRLMDSVERRTEEDQPPPNDEDLFRDFGNLDQPLSQASSPAESVPEVLVGPNQSSPSTLLSEPESADETRLEIDRPARLHSNQPALAHKTGFGADLQPDDSGEVSSVQQHADPEQSSFEQANPEQIGFEQTGEAVVGEIVDHEEPDLGFGSDSDEFDVQFSEPEQIDYATESPRVGVFESDEDELVQPRQQGRRDNRDRRGGRDRDRKDRRNGRDAGRDLRDSKDKPPIQEIFKRGQEVIVQVTKEGIGSKGPTLTTYIGIAGRYLVLMPGLERIGVSRKIDDEQQRRRLKEILSALKPPPGIGFIIRTAGSERTTRELQNDLVYLLKLWQVVVRRIRRMKAPVEVYRETDMITRTIRDTFTADIDTIWVDEPNAYQHAREFLESVMPRYAERLRLYEGTEPLFFKYHIEEEIAKIQNKYVPLPHGGSIVIEQTEALVAIDVNSGNFRADNNPEETAFQMNLHAAREIARQLRLRDLGGVIVNDFIDMKEERHRRAVEQAMRDAIKRDRARTKVLKISPFGLIEMTRQRIRPSLKKSIYQDCPWCRATGYVKSPESMSLDVMRLLQLAAHREGIHQIVVRIHSEVANYLLNRKRREVVRLEEMGELSITITGLPHVPPETLEITCYDRNGLEVRFQPFEPPARLGQRNAPATTQRDSRSQRDDRSQRDTR